MPNIPLTFLLHIAILLSGVAGLRIAGRSTAARPLLLGIGVVLIYWVISPLGFWMQKQLPLLSELRWNWTGKILVIAAALAYARWTGLTRAEIGLTWRQAAGSTWPALGVIAVMCGGAWTVEAFQADGTDLSAARLLFQAVMPGLDDELVFRGVLLVFFMRAFETGDEMAGGRFGWSGLGWAGIAITALFGLGHGLFVVDGEIVAQWRAMLITGALGAGLFWIRIRTGSLLLPVVAHNLLNIGYSFF